MNTMTFSEVPADAGNYPTWEWPDTASHLLFDVGFSYAMLHRAERMLQALSLALEDYVDASPSNQELKDRLDSLLAQMQNFKLKRLSGRDEVYNAGYLAGAKLDAKDDMSS